jgi:hypothetical protein
MTPFRFLALETGTAGISTCPPSLYDSSDSKSGRDCQQTLWKQMHSSEELAALPYLRNSYIMYPYAWLPLQTTVHLLLVLATEIKTKSSLRASDILNLDPAITGWLPLAYSQPALLFIDMSGCVHSQQVLTIWTRPPRTSSKNTVFASFILIVTIFASRSHFKAHWMYKRLYELKKWMPRWKRDGWMQ